MSCPIVAGAAAMVSIPRVSISPTAAFPVARGTGTFTGHTLHHVVRSRLIAICYVSSEIRKSAIMLRLLLAGWTVYLTLSLTRIGLMSQLCSACRYGSTSSIRVFTLKT